MTKNDKFVLWIDWNMYGFERMIEKGFLSVRGKSVVNTMFNNN